MMLVDRLICGESSSVLNSLDENSVDLVVTSPPYDNLRTYDGFLFSYQEIIISLFKIIKDGGVVVWVVADQTKNGSESGSSFSQALFFKNVGFNLHDTMIYRKINYIPLTHNRYEQEFEYMFVFSKGKPKTFNPIKVPCKTVGTERSRSKSNKEIGSSVRNRNEVTITKPDKIKGNIWDYPVSNTKYDHPAIFPEQLAIDHILSWSNENDLVLDPFCGSGTTCKVAKDLNRRYIGIDVSEKYISIAESRINGNETS